MKPSVLLLAAVLGLLVAPAVPQSTHHFPTPPESMDPQQQDKEQQATLPRHLDLAELQREANDLARTAQTIPSDLASVRQGILPKDTIDKLKQIEKLSKHPRTQLNP